MASVNGSHARGRPSAPPQPDHLPAGGAGPAGALVGWGLLPDMVTIRPPTAANHHYVPQGGRACCSIWQ